jgi:tetratricopeptide (TPR) repeat protein
MARLHAMLAEALKGHGRVVAFLGEAGVGKTRLAAELAAEAIRLNARVVIGRSYESEQILPFGPWVEVLKAGQGLTHSKWAETLALTVRRELSRLLPDLAPADGPPAAPPDYLNLFEGISLLVEHVASRQPIVVVLEDLHWADEMSVRLLAFVGRRLQTSPVLLMVTARVEDLVDSPMLRRALDELAPESHMATLALGPLSRNETAGLVQALSRSGTDQAVTASLGEQVWRTSGGNPFVAIEAMRAAAQEALAPGLEAVPLPERVRDMIGRQLDRLDERKHELVALASVVGREFSFALLQQVAGCDEEEIARGVEELTRRRVLHSVGESLDFTHDRVREVAYGRILASRRKGLHRRVAEALASIYAEDLEPHHLVLGLHYAEGEVWDRAIVHLRRAGAAAADRSASREALACFERALSAVAQCPESRSTLEQAFEIRLELRQVLNLSGDAQGALDHLREAEALAERLNDDSRRGRVLALMANTHSLFGKMDDAVVTGTRALEIAEHTGDLKLRILATTTLEQAHFLRGEYERVVGLASANIGALTGDWLHECVVGYAAPTSIPDRHLLVLSLAQLGRFAEAAPDEAEAIRLANLTHHAYTISLAHTAAGTLHLFKGDWAKASPLLQHAVAALPKANVFLLPSMVAAWAWALAHLGETEEAVNRLREVGQLLERLAASGVVLYLGGTYHFLGRACLQLGRLDEAQRFGDRAVEHSTTRPGITALAQHLLGDVATHPDRFDAESSEIHYRQALEFAEQRRMRPLVAHCHLGLGKLRRRTGKIEQAHAHLTSATALYRQMDMRFWLEQAEAELTLT